MISDSSRDFLPLREKLSVKGKLECGVYVGRAGGEGGPLHVATVEGDRVVFKSEP